MIRWAAAGSGTEISQDLLLQTGQEPNRVLRRSMILHLEDEKMLHRS